MPYPVIPAAHLRLYPVSAIRAMETANPSDSIEPSLMERAAAAATRLVTTLMPEPGAVLILAGPGNNGGDAALVAAQLASAADPHTGGLQCRGGGRSECQGDCTAPVRAVGHAHDRHDLVGDELAVGQADPDDAARLAESVLKEDASQDLALYLLAVIAARAGRTDEAIARLRDAMEINPECRLQARQDEEFDPLLDLAEYQQLLEAPPAPMNMAAAKRPAKRTR